MDGNILENSNQGYIQAKGENGWQYVCGLFDGATVACREMGFESGEATGNLSFISNTDALLYAGVFCSNEVSRLKDCDFRGTSEAKSDSCEAIEIQCHEFSEDVNILPFSTKDSFWEKLIGTNDWSAHFLAVSIGGNSDFILFSYYKQ